MVNPFPNANLTVMFRSSVELSNAVCLPETHRLPVNGISLCKVFSVDLAGDGGVPPASEQIREQFSLTVKKPLVLFNVIENNDKKDSVVEHSFNFHLAEYTKLPELDFQLKVDAAQPVKKENVPFRMKNLIWSDVKIQLLLKPMPSASGL
ncbi:hypothetical protein llap_15052 [Limosa lapponica baueri]|uniref:Uncharacterized protein n=1 Tax=Limosa lapponica baueri TaxID=1758121 RepID=A0A2I0TLN9_LIMLA|nr:hypothetical protein llap_15052 [Limosa lapponica baueri]